MMPNGPVHTIVTSSCVPSVNLTFLTVALIVAPRLLPTPNSVAVVTSLGVTPLMAGPLRLAV